MPQLAKLLVVTGLCLCALGLALWVGDKLGLGRLPGDLVIKGKNSVFHFPIVTSLVVSVILTVLLNLWFRR
jgi:hypothetical protein